MNVKKSIVILTVIAVFIILMAVFAVVSFPIADTVYDYNGYATTIKLGLDLSGGVSAVFNVVPDDYGDLEARVDGTVSSLQSLLVSEGYTEATVTKTQSGGNFSIRVEVPDVNNAEDLLDLIGTPARLQMTGEDYGDTLPADAKVFIEGSQHLESAYVTANTSSSSSSGFEYVVALRFNDAGTKAFAELTDGTYENCYIYINGSKYSTVTINDQITDGNAIISSTSWANDYNAADEFATQLQAGAFGVTLEVSEVRNISPTLGSDAVRVALIAGGIGVGLIFVFMAVMYRGLGLAADIALAVYIVLLLWFCSVLPWVQLTLPGIAGLLLSIGMAVDANIIIFERIRDEYRHSSKPIPSAVKVGFKRSFAAILDGNVTTLIGAVVLWIIGSASIVGFAVTLFIGIILSMFTALVITRLLIKCFLPINSTSEKFYGLRRAKENEVKQDVSFIKNETVKGGEVK